MNSNNKTKKGALRKVKKCQDCNRVRPIIEFSTVGTEIWMLRSTCRRCRTAKARAASQREPQKAKARGLVAYAKQTGRLTSQPCAHCLKYGLTDRVSTRRIAHHSDYKKPLEVVWLCDAHHQAWHRLFVAER